MMPSIRCFAREVSLAVATIALAATGALADEPIRSFGAIQQVFTASCALTSCHSSVARKGNLILEHEDLSYASLVDQPPDHPDAKKMALSRVKSFDPERSFLIRKLKGLGPGDAMPQGAGMLPAETIKMIEDWIARGAHSRQEECVTKAPDPMTGGPGHLNPGDPTLCSDVPVQGEFHWQPEDPLPVPEVGTGVQMYVPRRDVAPGTEWETCYAFRFKDLPNAAQLQSNVIAQQEYRMHAGSHHLLLYMYFGAHPEQFKEGFFDCSAGNCIHPGECPEDSGTAQIAVGGSQVAGTRYVVDYPRGVGLPILGGDNAVMIANLHYTNPFQPQQDIYGEGWINLYFHKPDEFKAILDGIFAINSQDLIVEPYTTKTIHRLWRPRSFLGGAATDAAVFQLFGHMHKRGRAFDIDLVENFCTGDCNADRQVKIGELLKGVNISLGSARINRCSNADGNRDGEVSVDELISAVNGAVQGCSPDAAIYRTTEWDAAPVQEYGSPYLAVNANQALRWSCTHENGRMLENGEEDPTYPAKKCSEGCAACGWDDASRTCKFNRDGSNRTFQEGEPMPLVFGLLADDDMCNMFGYFIRQSDLPLLE
jgi:hypothetical protein